MAVTRSSLDLRTWKRGWKGLRKINSIEMIASSSSSSAENNITLTENDIPSASLAWRNPSALKNEKIEVLVKMSR